MLPEPVTVKVQELISLTDALKQPPVDFKSMRPAPRAELPSVRPPQKIPTAIPVRSAAPIAPVVRPAAIVPSSIPKKPIKLFSQYTRPIEKKLMPKTVVRLLKK